MSMDFIEALNEFEREKGISKDVLFEAIEAALISSYKRNFNTAQNVRVDINRNTGVIKVYARKTDRGGSSGSTTGNFTSCCTRN